MDVFGDSLYVVAGGTIYRKPKFRIGKPDVFYEMVPEVLLDILISHKLKQQLGELCTFSLCTALQVCH